jgi:hypothetical protein
MYAGEGEEWKKVWYHKTSSLWKEARKGVWCHVQRRIRPGLGDGWWCREYDEVRQQGKINSINSFLDDDYIYWDRKPEEEENEFGPVTP